MKSEPSLPLVSIVIDNYNYCRFLGAAVDSALGQSYPNVEVIVVDDGSTDGSRQLIAGYGSSIVPVFKANGGQVSAMNAGFTRCSGSIVFFLDADDVLRPDIVTRVVQAMHENPQLSKVQFRLVVTDATGRPTGEEKPPTHITMLDGDLRRHYLTFPDDVWRLPTSGNAFTRRVLDQILPIPEAQYGTLPGDTYLTHVAPLFGPVRFLDDVGGEYRLHGGNGYELAENVLSLDRIRVNIVLAQRTHVELKRFARQINLELPSARGALLSTSYLINRMISCRLEPAKHPIPGDTRLGILLLGIRSSSQRFDVSLPMKVVYALWFAAMAAVPRAQAALLAERVVFPRTRPWAGRFLKLVQRPRISRSANA